MAHSQNRALRDKEKYIWISAAEAIKQNNFHFIGEKLNIQVSTQDLKITFN